MNIAKVLRTQFYKTSPMAASAGSNRVTNAGIVRDKITCSKLTIEAIEQRVKYVQS